MSSKNSVSKPESNEIKQSGIKKHGQTITIIVLIGIIAVMAWFLWEAKIKNIGEGSSDVTGETSSEVSGETGEGVSQ